MHHAYSVTMIGASRHQSGRAVYLFGKHRADQRVRPSLDAERQSTARNRQHPFIQSVGAPDDKDYTSDAIIPQAAEPIGELPGGLALSSLIAGDDIGVRQLFEKDVTF